MRLPVPRTSLVPALVLALALPALPALADADDELPDAPLIFERVRVVGSPDRVLPGSVTYLDREQLERQDYSDVHRILSQIPGVYVQEEDGYGLRPNIGMRGSGSDRSSKITTMEDGVLIAPAPYAAPSAYYFPTAGRMEGVEVRKGSASVQYGPFTTGGVLNLISSSIPSAFGGDVSVAIGEDDTVRGRLKLGDSGERVGWLFETWQHDTDGFKDLDGGGDTGYDLQDYLAKVRFTSRPSARRFQALEIKAGKTEQAGDETYLGLTDADFDADPFRRYAASQQDRIDSDHEQLHARYLFKPNDGLDVTATLYRNDFYRNWRKVESVGGESVADVLADPTQFANEVALLRGEIDSADDALALRNNRRDYYSQGVQLVFGITPEHGAVDHDVEIGVRYHQDEEDRFQEEDGFRIVSGRMEQTSEGAPGSQANRVSTGDSLALFAQDQIRVGRWTLAPGARFEWIDFRREDWADPGRTIPTTRAENEVDVLIPGLGVSRDFGRGSSVFGGVHRGFAPPGPAAVDTDSEESVNWELGHRRVTQAFAAEFVGFFNDYSNLLGTCTVSSGCSSAEIGDAFDGGEVDVYGLEASLDVDDLARGRGARLRVPFNVVYTWTRAEFRNSFESDYDSWGDVVRGDELPYLPEHRMAVGTGLVDSRWSVFSNLIFVDEMRTVAGQGTIPQSESTDAHLLLDLAGNFQVDDGLRIFGRVQNVTDVEYVAARRPAGVRPGIDRTLLVGVGYSF